MYSFIRPFLFKFDPETAHYLALNALSMCPSIPLKSAKPIEAMGLTFAHSVGLAAGFDKNGDYISALAKLGFSFIEIGTVTPKPQVGNPKPRVFRLVEAESLINRLGFNNHGVHKLVENIRKSAFKGILGINIGKNKDTSLNDAVDDYRYCLQKVYPYASYITINISSPNTPGLRQLQQDEYLDNLLNELVKEQHLLADQYKTFIPLVLKLSPDESSEALKRIANTAIKHKLSGLIISNTTAARSGLSHLTRANEMGGLSGKALFKQSTACLRVIKNEVGDALTLIGVGGINSPADARAKLTAGADLLQVYTGLIYQGPQFIHTLVKGLAQHAK